MLKFETIRLIFAQRSSQPIAASVKSCAAYSSREVLFSQIHSLKFPTSFLPEISTLSQFQLSRRFLLINFLWAIRVFVRSDYFLQVNSIIPSKARLICDGRDEALLISVRYFAKLETSRFWVQSNLFSLLLFKQKSLLSCISRFPAKNNLISALLYISHFLKQSYRQKQLNDTKIAWYFAMILWSILSSLKQNQLVA